jgi:hypothetical protein
VAAFSRQSNLIPKSSGVSLGLGALAGIIHEKSSRKAETAPQLRGFLGLHCCPK